MKNKGLLIISIIVGVISFIAILFGAISNQLSIVIISFICICIAYILLVHWFKISFIYICGNCGENFKTTFWQNSTNINSFGVNSRKLKCPMCHQKSWCKGVPK